MQSDFDNCYQLPLNGNSEMNAFRCIQEYNYLISEHHRNAIMQSNCHLSKIERRDNSSALHTAHLFVDSNPIERINNYITLKLN